MQSRGNAFFAKSALTRRRFCLLIAALIFVVCISKPLAALLQRTLILRLQTVDETNFREAISHAPDKTAFLFNAWQSGKISHREAVVHFLKDAPEFSTPGADQILVAAARDGDASVREFAFAALAARKHSALPALIALELTDPDPELRLLAINYISYLPTNSALPLIAGAVNDTNVLIAASAVGALQKVAGTNFGLRVATLINDNLSEEAARDFESKRSAAKAWFASHEIKPAAPNSNSLRSLEPRPVVADFELRDVNGATVRLSDFRGKNVLLNFWATWCTACQPELATLNELQKRYPDDLVILGISLDSNKDAGDDAEENSKHTSVEQRVTRTVAARGIQYRILLDPKSWVGARFNGGELPTNVLINKNGRFARRFIGPRSLDVFEAMLRDAH